ncbi:hypothetical protein [Pseudomonas helleri]|uniref:hypothetical protein n=1 Tax=Pseudomonas helleri TaxID=1608996 RepID=UPI003F9A5A79
MQTIILNGVTINTHDHLWGLFDLTEVHTKLRLPRNASPSQWRHRHRNFLETEGHITSGSEGTYGDLVGLLGWVAWFDYGMYVRFLSVVSQGLHSDLRIMLLGDDPQCMSVAVNREVEA